ncbi:MAG: DUF2807 domain-containing protein [Chitinophagaceae bacterium]|nr:DUF2807 domain-containing protein [Chitinophagaceae bacterium]
MKKILFLLPLVAILVSSCFLGGKRIKGNGVIKSETRSTTSFSGVDVSGNADVYVKQDSTTTVRVETDENLLPYIIIENRNGTLHIYQKDNTQLKTTKGIKVYLASPQYSRFDASGACDYYSEGRITNAESISFRLSGASEVNMDLKAPVVKASLSGAGTVSLKGETKDLDIDGSGSTEVKCFDLAAENVKVSISGAGDADVFASVKLDVHVSGAGDVRYKGNAVVSQNISGAGSVKKAD